jgi:putative acetyltransferase
LSSRSASDPILEVQKTLPQLPLKKSEIVIRELKDGEECILWDVFYSAVHDVAARHYSQAQVDAWAPENLDKTYWVERIRKLQPFVAQSGDMIVGYTDLQPSGFIDHFFVSGNWGRRGVGTALMTHLIKTAENQKIPLLSAFVSLAAQSFFQKFGFEIIKHQTLLVRGVEIENAHMTKNL